MRSSVIFSKTRGGWKVGGEYRWCCNWIPVFPVLFDLFFFIQTSSCHLESGDTVVHVECSVGLLLQREGVDVDVIVQDGANLQGTGEGAKQGSDVQGKQGAGTEGVKLGI